MNSFDREQYLKQLRMYYSGDRDDTEQFLEDMSDSLDCYLEEHPSATVAEIFQHFGHPKELEEQYEEAILMQRSRKKQHFKKILIILVFSVCLWVLGAFIVRTHHLITEVNGHANIILEESDPDTSYSPDVSPSPNSGFHILKE